MFADFECWYDHEMESHRRQWVCPCCDAAPFLSCATFIRHLDDTHPQYIINEQMRDLISTTSLAQEDIDLRTCPLCAYSEEDMEVQIACRAFMSHLADHLEGLALDAYERSLHTVADGQMQREAINTEDDQASPSKAPMFPDDIQSQDNVVTRKSEETKDPSKGIPCVFHRFHCFSDPYEACCNRKRYVTNLWYGEYTQ